MKTLVLLSALAILVFQAWAKPNPEAGLEAVPPADVSDADDAPEAAGSMDQKKVFRCHSEGGTCRRKCKRNEVFLGPCSAGIRCCQEFA